MVYNIPYNRVKTQESCSIVTCMPCCFKKGGNTKICCCTAAQCFPASTYDNYTPVLVWPDIIERVRGNNETEYSFNTIYYYLLALYPTSLILYNIYIEYFGEEIALHALFLNHMTNWLTFATICGLLTWIHIAYVTYHYIPTVFTAYTLTT